jgi:hypothetical protein
LQRLFRSSVRRKRVLCSRIEKERRMLVAIAFLCLTTANDCEREAVVRAVVGQGLTPTGCLMDGAAGVAANPTLAAEDGYRVVIACRRRSALPEDARALKLPRLADCGDSGC